MAVPDLTDREADWLRATRTTSLLLSGTGEAPTAPARTPPGVATVGTRTVAEVVDWFGAMQGQDLASVMWSLGLRTGQTRAEVAAAFESGEVLRTWPMRGTLHVVPGRDARWMVEHLGVRALAGARARRQVLGIEQRDADRAADVLGEALVGGHVMTRAECVAVLEGAGIPDARRRAYHLLWYASQRGVTCVGPNRGKEQTFVLIDEFAPAAVGLDRPGALSRIAERFVRSHGPVSAHDLARWADITVSDARAGLRSVEGAVTRSIAGRELWMTQSVLDTVGLPEGGPLSAVPVRALPGFDEFVLGYRDRSAQLDPALERLVVPGGNGVFAPTLAVDGRVVGTWRRRELAGRIDLVATALTPIRARHRGLLKHALADYGTYVGKPSRISWTP